MDEKVKALEVTKTRAEPAPAPEKPACDRMPGDTRGFPARPKNRIGDYESKPDVHELYGEAWWPRGARRRK
jgi:hypothetical protein